MRERQHSRMIVCLLLAGPVLVYPAVAEIIDIVGDTSHQGTPGYTGKGNAFRVDTSTVLLEQEFYLSFSGSMTLGFYVYESPVEFGTYSLVQSTSANYTGSGADWYSSGPTSVPLTAGMYYILACSFSGLPAYYYGTGDSQAVSFGEQVHGFATGTHPLGPTISSTSNDQAIYHQRITTPEPATLCFLVLGGLLAGRRR